MIMFTVMRALLNGMIVIKNGRRRKQILRKSFYLLLGIHQDIGIGACQKTRKKRQKNCGSVVVSKII